MDVTFEVPYHGLFGERKKLATRAPSILPTTFDSRPPSALASPRVLPPQRVDVFAADKERSEEGNFVLGRRRVADL